MPDLADAVYLLGGFAAGFILAHDLNARARQRAKALAAELAESRRLNLGLAERVHKQSELLSKKAEVTK